MKRSLTLAVASVFLAAPAFGGVLHTAPASALFTEASLACGFRNVSSTPRDVTVELLDFAGNVVKGHTFALNAAAGGASFYPLLLPYADRNIVVSVDSRVSPAGSFRQAGPSRWSGLPFDDVTAP